MMALILDSKSLSVKIRSLDILAAAQPDPIARPTSAYIKASISAMPSPVTATISPLCLSPVTIRSLSVASARANTFKLVITLAKSSKFSRANWVCCSSPWASRAAGYSTSPPTRSLNASASITEFGFSMSASVRIPAFKAVFLAVSTWSPLIILTVRCPFY